MKCLQTVLALCLVSLPTVQGATLGNVCTGAGVGDCTGANVVCNSGTNCTCSSGFYEADSDGDCDDAGLNLNANCSGVAGGQADAACQSVNAQTTCVTSGSSSLCTCNANFYDSDGTGTAGGNCVAGLNLNADCSGVTGGQADAACQSVNAQTTCVNSGVSSLCACNAGYYDSDGTGTAGGNCVIGINLNGDCSGPTAGARDAACQAINTQTTCVTSGGSMLCTCNSGYFDSDGTGTPGGNCTSVLTTACSGEANCGSVDSNAECTNTDGSQKCMCKDGYTGGEGDVCVKSGAGLNTASYWLFISLLLLTTKGVLL